MSLIHLLSSLILTQLGLLSILVGAAYWSVKGSGIAAAAGIALVMAGAWSAIGVLRRFKEKRRKPRG